MAVRADFRFGAFVREYRAFSPDAFVLKIRAADLPLSVGACFRIMTMGLVIL
jgi:hypothetical protein